MLDAICLQPSMPFISFFAPSSDIKFSVRWLWPAALSFGSSDDVLPAGAHGVHGAVFHISQLKFALNQAQDV